MDKSKIELLKRIGRKDITIFLFKKEKRQCINRECREYFDVALADPKKFCSYKCATQINNPRQDNNFSKTRKKLKNLYERGLSMQEISETIGWKYKKVVYLMKKFNIPRRTRSDATYAKRNPAGDPFEIKKNLTKEEVELKGLGIGLYWGEGNKRSQWSVRIGNTDANFIKKFKEFLLKICGVREEKIKYSLQIFSDVDPGEAL